MGAPGEADPPLAGLAVRTELCVKDAVGQARTDLLPELRQVLAQLLRVGVRLGPLEERVQREVGFAWGQCYMITIFVDFDRLLPKHSPF
jgi:hypothetical protein